MPVVDALNAFAGITTIGSCGGHPEQRADQAAEGEWWVSFEVARTDDGWFALEFLAWAVNGEARQEGAHLALAPYAPAPFRHEPGEVLRFGLECFGPGHRLDRPADFAGWLRHQKAEYFFSPDEAR